MKKSLLILGLLMSFILSIQAQTLIDGIYYTLNSSKSTCTVTYKSSSTYNSYSGDIVIPSTVTYSGKTYTVTEIGNSAFRLSSGLTSVVIPNTVTKIGDYAFYDCSQLKCVRIEDGTTPLTMSYKSTFVNTPFETLYIGRDITFSGSVSPFRYSTSSSSNSSVLSVEFGPKVTNIPKYLLEPFTSLKSLTIGAGILTIGSKQCTPVKTIFLGNTVPTGYTNVDGTINYASSDNYPSTSTTTVTWKKYAQLSSMFEVGGVKYVRSAVRNCEAIDCNYDTSSEIVNIGETIKYGNITMTVDYINPYTCYDNKYVKTCNITFGKNIGKYAFKGCTNIVDNAIIKANLIEEYAFSESMNTEDVSLDVNANTIEKYAFNQTTNVISANVVVDSIGEYAFRSSMWRNVATLTLNARAISQYSFYNTRALQNANVVVTEGIAKGAFYESMSLSGISSTLKVKAPVIGDFAFMKTKSLNEATIEATTLERSAFNGSAIINLEIPDCVKTIGKSCFSNNKSLTTVDIGSGITTIPDSVFYSCDKLSGIEIPSNIKSIDNYVFAGCSYLGKVIISDCESELILGGNYRSAENAGSTKVEWNAMFSSCKLDEVYIGRNLTYNTTADYGYSPFYKNTYLRKVINTAREVDITENEFNGCTNLQEVQLDEGVLTLGDYAFNGCSSLPKIVLPNSIKTNIAKYCFAGCSSLKDVTIGTGIPVIDDFAFNGCSSLPHIEIPCNVDSINSSVFVGCTSLKTVVFKEENSNLFLGSNGYINSNPTAHESSVQNLPMFKDCPLDSVFIGRRIKYNAQGKYGFSPFCHNTTLRSVFVTDAETAISDYEFYLCTNLKTIEMGDGVESIGYWSFSGCNTLDRVKFGTGMKTIGAEAFSDCTKVTQIYSNTATPPTCGTQALDDIDEFNCILYVPNGTVEKYNTAPQWDYFYAEESGRTPISSISLEGAITSVYVGETMTIPVTVTPSDATAPRLKWSSSNEKVLTVDDKGVLTAKKQGSAVVTVSTTDGSNLSATININVSVFGGTVYFNVLSSENKIVEVTSKPNGTFYTGTIGIPSTVSIRGTQYTVVAVGSNAFYGCGGLTAVQMPNSINTIGANAFSSCRQLTEITIPNSVTTIKSGAFANSKNLAKVVAMSSTPPTTAENAFSGISSSAVLYVPQQSDIEVYTNATGWSTFATSGNIKSLNVMVSSISLNVTSKTLSINETLKLTATVAPSDVTNKSVTWTSSNTSVATVDANGTITAKSKGNAVITVTANDGSNVSAKCTVNVLGTININNIYYKILSTTNKTIGVTFAGEKYDDVADEYKGSVVIPATVTHSGVKYTVTEICDSACMNCTNLESVTIPEGVTSIGKYSFLQCFKLKIKLPSTIRNIKWGAFRTCTSIDTITLPEGMTTIGIYAFSGCTGITSVTLPSSLTSIGAYAFRGCYGITEIIIPGKVTSIGEDAFINCKNLATVTVERETPATAGATTFSGLPTNAVLYVPTLSSVNSYKSATGWSVFKTVKNNKLVVDGIYYNITSTTNKTAEVTFAGATASEVANEYSGKVVIPSTVLYNGVTYNITAVGDSAFQGCENLQSVTISNGVTKVGVHGFINCKGLSEVVLPKSLISIGGSAFNACESLESIALPEGLKTIEWYAFANCKKLKLEIPSTVTSLGEGVFFGCTSLDAVNIPKGVKTLIKQLFNGCTGLTTVTGGENVTTIGDKVFNGCTKLKEYSIPTGVTSIGEYAFQNTALQNVVIPSGVTKIKQYTFSGCSSLANVVIPESITSIGERVFNGCSKLESVVLPTKLKDLSSGVFAGCSMLKSVNIPNTITAIYGVTFSHCYSLTDVIIPESVTSIGSYAFRNCTSLAEIVIPESVETIAIAAFKECSSLRKVVVESETPATADATSFKGLPSDAVLYVPSMGAVDVYEAATGWNVFTTILPPFSLGDINCDGEVNVTDVVKLYSYILGHTTDIEESVVDLNGDGEVNVSDIVKLYSIILSSN